MKYLITIYFLSLSINSNAQLDSAYIHIESGIFYNNYDYALDTIDSYLVLYPHDKMLLCYKGTINVLTGDSTFDFNEIINTIPRDTSQNNSEMFIGDLNFYSADLMQIKYIYHERSCLGNDSEYALYLKRMVNRQLELSMPYYEKIFDPANKDTILRQRLKIIYTKLGLLDKLYYLKSLE